ncbi:MAG: hypothetical protein NT062_11680 [Proteobacteria bacterium]|nr:hypothetical protein [Pseudomonadota bacterium]
MSIRVPIAAVVLTLGISLGACDRSQGVPDEELGALVLAPKPPVETVDVGRAATDPDELGRALLRPYRVSVAALGPHAITIAMTTTIEADGKVVDTLVEKTVVELGDGPTYHAVYESSADYGREAIFLGGRLFLRPRYQRWHERAPETPDEPAELRDTFAAGIGATWDLVAPGAQLTDKGATTVAGRPGRAIAIAMAARPATPRREAVVQRKWREARMVEALEGTVVLDAASGSPLAAKLSGAIAFVRDGKKLVMKVVLDASVDKIGTKAAIAAPAATEVVATPERQREVDDHDFLLDGIAPPIRKNLDGSPVPPNPHFAGSGSAGDVRVPTPPPVDAAKPTDDDPPKKKKRRHRDDESTDDKAPKADPPTEPKPTDPTPADPKPATDTP